MAFLQEMLSLNGGSFQRAEQMALNKITQGQPDVWLDLAALLHAQGKIEGSKQAIEEHLKVFPANNRALHALTWFKLYDGDLQGGLEHIAVGHLLGTLPTETAHLTKPEWDGKVRLKGKTVLLVAEGGQGDQMMAVRSAEWLAELGANVVVSAEESLLPLLSRSPHVSAVISKYANAHVYHDYWILGMSAWKLCKRTWETLWTSTYLRSPQEINPVWESIIPRVPGVMNVGVRWSGDKRFEHMQLRLFPPSLMFGLSGVQNCRFFSLQKDDKQLDMPAGIVDLEPFLSSWEQTAAAISRMDLVISSCTSIAHLAAGMAKWTWVVVPAMPYYPWARPGRTSDWYPTATVYRQRCFGQWAEPFEEIRNDLAREAITWNGV